MKLKQETPPEGTIRDWLHANAKKHPTKDAFVFADGAMPMTWADAAQDANRIAQMIASHGVAKGESVAVLQPNGRDAVRVFLGAVYGGFRATMINLVAGDEAISYALGHCEARIALVHFSQTKLFERVAPVNMQKVDIETTATADLPELAPSDPALLMYTSGTTGRPKGVVHTHSSLLAGGWTTSIAHALHATDRGFCVLPLYHINGLCVTLMGTLVSGGSLAIAHRFSASQFWNQAQTHAVTWFSIVPTIVSHLLHGAEDPHADTISRIRFGRSASAPLAPDVQTAFEARFEIPIVETMGLTETAAQILSNPLPPGTRKIGSPGVAYGNEAGIMLADGSFAAPEQTGEIVIRGPNVMLEYLKNPEATDASFTQQGWLRTGDLGKMDADGYFFVTGRLKELIIKGGENIAPREIDEALYAHSDVVEAAAFAVPCDIYGERVEAAVKVRRQSDVSAQDLLQSCIDRLGPFKSPDQVHFLDELPKGPSGKIQRLAIPPLVNP